jgi:hypothetical protein
MTRVKGLGSGLCAHIRADSKRISQDMFGSAPFDTTNQARSMLRQSGRSATDIVRMPMPASIPAAIGHLLRIMFRAVTTLSV